ncbi:MAG: hypothetical protein F2813_00295 [Actinobacteria bacterium]|nr:hypothetical protein [Actinomycetota bacterium]
MADDKHTGPGQPGGAGRWGEPTPFAEAVENMLQLRREWDARPEVVQKKAEDAAATERQRLAKLQAKGKDSGLIGPPDPRKGRVPMTR